MKTTFILIALLLAFSITARSQQKISASELPKEALQFLEKHFNGIGFEKVKKDSEHGEKGYEVKLSNGVEVEFWKDGKWREVDGKDKPIPIGFVAQSIVDYVRKNYPGQNITHIDYGHKDVDVDLTGKIDLEFSKDGKFLKAD